MEYGLRYLEDGKVKLSGYTYSNWIDIATDKESNAGCCFFFGLAMTL
jgi:hypothetical protein